MMRRDSGYRHGASADARSTNKSVNSDLTYQRYTDWDSSIDSRRMAPDARDEHSSNSSERHATYARDEDAIMSRVNPRHQRRLRSENANLSQRGIIGPQDQLFPPTTATAKSNGEDDTSVYTSITNSRSVTSPERKLRNSRYEPVMNTTHSACTVSSRDEMPCVVRTRSKNLPQSDACIIESHRSGNASEKSAQVSKQPSHWSEDLEFLCVDSMSGNSRLRGQSDSSPFVRTATVMPAKPPLGTGRVHGSTPRINNTASRVSTVVKSEGKLMQSNTSVSSFTRDDDTYTIENSIPSGLQFVTKSVPSTKSKYEQGNSDYVEMKYWMDLSVCAAKSVLQAKGSEALAEKAATTVVEAGAKMNLREKKRDMQKILRFLATKTSVAVLEAGGNQRTATAVAHAIVTHESLPGDLESITETDTGRSVMLSKIDRSISQNMQKSKKILRISDLTVDQQDKLAEKVKGSSMKLTLSSTIGSEGPKSTKANGSTQSRSSTVDAPAAAVLYENVAKKTSRQKNNPPQENVRYSSSVDKPVAMTETTHDSKNSDITITQSNLSFEKSSQHAENGSQSLKAKEKALEEAARLNAQREKEINERMAALDAATNALLAKANNVQHYIDQQVAQKQQADACHHGTSKEFLHAFSCDDPGFHHNFSGRSFQVDNRRRHHSYQGLKEPKSVFEKLANGFTQMLDLTCASPATGTQASSSNFTTQFSSYAPENNRLPNLNCNYSEPYDDVNDLISALTDDIPMHKKWQQKSRLTLVTDHQGLDDNNRTHEPMDSMDVRRISPIDNKRVATPPLVGSMPSYQAGPEQAETYANKSPPAAINHTGAINNTTPPTNKSMHQAFDSAMNQLSSHFFQAPHAEPEEIIMTDPTQKHRSSIGKLKSAFTRKRTPRSVTFGVPNDAPVTPKSPGRMFFGRRKLESSEC